MSDDDMIETRIGGMIVRMARGARITASGGSGVGGAGGESCIIFPVTADHLAALTRDAERYRWLRDGPTGLSNYYGTELDDAIDAAREAGANGGFSKG